MKSKRKIITIAGILFFLSIALTLSWLFSSKNLMESRELGFEETIAKINNGSIKEVSFKILTVDLIDINGDRLHTRFGSYPAREILLHAINEFNNNHTTSVIKYSEEPNSTDWRWILLVNRMPFYLMWIITLAVVVYAVRTLSRNKG